MKKRIQKTLSALGLAASLTVTGYGTQIDEDKKTLQNTNVVEDTIENKEIEKKEEEIVIEDFKIFARALSNEIVHLYYFAPNKKLSICGQENNENKVLSDLFYKKINLIIQQAGVTSLYFENLDNNFDFSKIDFSNIKSIGIEDFNGDLDHSKIDFSNIESLDLKNFNGKFNYTKEDFSNLKELSLGDFKEKIDCSIFNQKYNNLYFYNTPIDMAIEVLSNCDVSDGNLFWHENVEEKENLKILLEHLNENNVYIKKFYLKQNQEKSNGLTDEEFSLLSKLNTKTLSIEGAKNNKGNLLNLNLELNGKIQNLDITQLKLEIGKVNINSKNKELHIYFSDAIMTENTKFRVPDDSWVSLNNVICKNISVFDDLANVGYLSFLEDRGPGPEADNSGELYYCKDKEVNFYDVMNYTGEPIEMYRDYKEVLKDLKKYYELTKIKNKLNISENETKRYFYTPSIGDIVNLKDNNVLVYKNATDLKNKQNPTTSLYETSILRRIQSIVMINENKEEVVVDNMEDYELYKQNNFSVIGYYLVNQYSLNPDGTLTTELVCSEDDLNLERTIPFR